VIKFSGLEYRNFPQAQSFDLIEDLKCAQLQSGQAHGLSPGKEVSKLMETDSHKMVNVDQAYNYRTVSDSVATAGVVSSKILAVLRDAGIEVVINLLPESSEYAVVGEKQIIEKQGIEYQYLPIDFSAPKREEYLQFKELMVQSEGKKLLIHCAANYRVSAFYSRYAIENGIWTVDEADNFMLSIWQPSEYPAWVEWLSKVGSRN
jgi:protein tyrosine phosphatase (PTP) superfamily phosphohydrolase (DUF442 family)